MQTIILKNDHGELRLSLITWTAARCLGSLHSPGHNAAWPLVRHGDDRVAGEDAEAFAGALEVALADVSDEPGDSFPWDEFSGPHKQGLRDLITFCRNGKFTIET